MSFVKHPNCLSECVGVSEHAPLCPVAHTPEEIEIALYKMAFRRLNDLIPQLEMKDRFSSGWQEAISLIEAGMSGAPHEQATNAKKAAEAAAAQSAEAEKKVPLKCVGCGSTNNAKDEEFYDKTVAVRSDTFARCDKCNERVMKDPKISHG